MGEHIDPSRSRDSGCHEQLVALDIFLSGPLFLDVVFAGLPTPPRPGTEVWAEEMGSAPGGIANLAVAAARLGLRTGLATGFGDDSYGRWCRDVLISEGISLDRSVDLPREHTSVTVSYQYDGDRAMVTHGHPLPMSYDELISEPPRSKAVVLNDLGGNRAQEQWWRLAAAAGAKIFADTGWDTSGEWDLGKLGDLSDCYAFLPNEVEAMAYTRTRSPRDALHALADKVPVTVITQGGGGAIAIDNETGEEASAPALQMAPIDFTGAGDVFVAAFAAGSIWGLNLEERLALANLCSGLAVQRLGGSLSAPSASELLEWWQQSQSSQQPYSDESSRPYEFLARTLGASAAHQPRRTEATIGLGGVA